ncbi:hypothetical protein OIU78_029545 [Salix suchowensis]|nr:hypothetical protein OIU78_029545 [Salix suchowensis]
MISDCLGKPGYPFGHNAVLPKLELFNGQNAIVAVNVHLGYNQEDSLVMKRASLGRGWMPLVHLNQIYMRMCGCVSHFLLLVMLFNSFVAGFDLLVLETSFSNMHGQKGVLGFLESQENFPFTIQGVFLIL